MIQVTMKELLEAGVHFGHQTRRWNPKMKEYIFGERNGIYIIDLQKTLKMFKEALQSITELAAQGKIILYVGTKRQAQDAIAEEAQRCGMYFVNQRWLGGLLTNFATIQRSIKRLKDLEAMKADGSYELRSKKEVARLERERLALEKNLSGIKNMPRLPDALFVVDSGKEEIAILEARKLSIPVFSIVDTNCNPDVIDYIIPGNDDALRAIRLFTQKVADAILEGQQFRLAQEAEAEKVAQEQATTDGTGEVGVPAEAAMKTETATAGGESPTVGPGGSEGTGGLDEAGRKRRPRRPRPLTQSSTVR
ncbi:MAG: 30S ribosomal protein S2 [Acidobacteriia bacterium]|nr:30S ribosomal protein S2 [Terriglobia bacterium]